MAPEVELYMTIFVTVPIELDVIGGQAWQQYGAPEMLVLSPDILDRMALLDAGMIDDKVFIHGVGHKRVSNGIAAYAIHLHELIT